MVKNGYKLIKFDLLFNGVNLPLNDILAIYGNNKRLSVWGGGAYQSMNFAEHIYICAVFLTFS